MRSDRGGAGVMGYTTRLRDRRRGPVGLVGRSRRVLRGRMKRVGEGDGSR